MTAKKELPPINLTAPRRPALGALAPRTALTDEQIEANSRTAGASWGASQQIAPPVAPAVPARKVEMAKLGIVIPAYVDQQLRDAAHKQRRTVTSLVLEALHTAGFEIDAADMVADKRKRQ